MKCVWKILAPTKHVIGGALATAVVFIVGVFLAWAICWLIHWLPFPPAH